MLIRTFVPVTALAAGTVALALLAAFPPRPIAGAVARVSIGDDGTFAKAPLSLGNPFAAATLQWLRGTEFEDADGATLDGAAGTAYSETVAMRAGDSFAALLTRHGVSRDDAQAAIAALKDVFNPKSIRTGQDIELSFTAPVGFEAVEAPRFEGFSFAPDYSRRIEVARADEGFSATEWQAELTRAPVRAAGAIDSSLYVAGTRAGIPPRVMAELIRVYSYDVDFQRDIQRGDAFEVVFEAVRNDEGETVHAGAIQYAALTLSGARKAVYRHAMLDGQADYFNDKGESVRKALLRTPIDGAKLSSGFGRRTHPILGYTAMHRGVDFAAPAGTPIYAAGDGTVAHAEFKGAYGKYVQIRHNGQYATAYAHMSRFGKTITAGKRVRQGDVIGYVGTTGRSTGPHLHYEILVGGAQTNPLKVKMPVGPKLDGKDLVRFQQTKKDLERLATEATPAQPVKTASHSPPGNSQARR